MRVGWPGLAGLEISGFQTKQDGKSLTVQRRDIGMQVVIVVPEPGSAFDRPGGRLARKICGVDLLARTLATAQRAGAKDVLLVWPQRMTTLLAEAYLQVPRLRKKGTVRLVQATTFDAKEPSSWKNLQAYLDDRFVWLPWNWVTYPRALANLAQSDESPTNWAAPAWVSRDAVVSGVTLPSRTETDPSPEGVAVTSDATAAAAERFLVRTSGKVLDGIH